MFNVGFWPSDVFNGDRSECAREAFDEHSEKREVPARPLGNDAILPQRAVERKLGAVDMGEDDESSVLIDIGYLRESSEHSPGCVEGTEIKAGSSVGRVHDARLALLLESAGVLPVHPVDRVGFQIVAD